MVLIKKLLVILGLAASTSVSAKEPQVVTDALASAEWISRALTSSGDEADFSLESLREIDRFLEEQAPGGNPVPDGLLSASLGSRLFALGAYVGETIRRSARGSWSGDDSDPKAEINISVELESGKKFWPVQRVMKRFKNGSEDGYMCTPSPLQSPNKRIEFAPCEHPTRNTAAALGNMRLAGGAL